MTRNGLFFAFAVIGALSMPGDRASADACGGTEPECLMQRVDTGGECYRCKWNGIICVRGKRTFCINEFIPDAKMKIPSLEELQQALKKKNYDVGVSGKFDVRTEKAIESFQRQQGLKVDGKVTPKMLEALER